MTTITAQCLIEAPINVCFSTSLDFDVELQAVREDSIQAIDGVTSGLIGAGETVTWKVKQLGFWVTHKTLISRYDAPSYFQDSMLEGLFRSFRHDHFFTEIKPGQTHMRDEMHFTMPWYLMGQLTEVLVVRRRLSNLLERRNAIIKRIAEHTS